MTINALVQHEAVAVEQRVWIRIIRRCNNRCQFCLDSDGLDGELVPKAIVLSKMAEARCDGSQRLILSGGEATLHPDFFAFIQAGRSLGYSWIQTISNGRRFAYEAFTREAARRGLNEVTFSIHGHKASVHDELAGVPGAFDQAVRGLTHVMSTGMVANIDVVLNRRNIDHLSEILGFFLEMGVREFDLLWLVPFGRAYHDHKELFLSAEEASPHIQRALAVCRQPNVHVWTNRMPPTCLEGREDLIQEPHKLLDEIAGRIESFVPWIRSPGARLQCEGDRCRLCAIANACQTLGRYRDRLAGLLPWFTHVVVPSGSAGSARDAWTRHCRKHGIARLEVAANSAHDALEIVEELRVTPSSLAITLACPEEVDQLFAWHGPRQIPITEVGCRSLDDSPERIIKLLRENPQVSIEIVASKGNWISISSLPTWLREGEPQHRIILAVRNHELVSSELHDGVPPEQVHACLRRLSKSTIRVRNIPCCLGGEQIQSDSTDNADQRDCLTPDLFDAEGELDPKRFVSHFIERHAYAKSNRCSQCREQARCVGLHINAIRAHGFASMMPIGPPT